MNQDLDLEESSDAYGFTLFFVNQFVFIFLSSLGRKADQTMYRF